jgi:hypothetical protein
MSRVSLVRKAFALSKVVRDSRAVLAKALGDESAMKAVALAQNIVEQVARFVENPAAFTIEDFRRLNAKIMAANKLVAQALTGQGQQPPLRGLQEAIADDAVPTPRRLGSDDTDTEEESEPEIPPNQDEKDEDEIDEGDVPSGARFPSEIQPKPPAGKRPRKPRARKKGDEEFEKSASAVLTFQAKERLQGLDSPDDFMNAILPIRRRTKDSAIMQTAGGD